MKNKKIVFLKIALLCFALNNFNTQAQVGIGVSSPDASAQLEINSTTKGMLVPTMTTVQKNAIVSPATGLLVYDTTLNSFAQYDGTTWINQNSISAETDATGNIYATGGVTDSATPIKLVMNSTDVFSLNFTTDNLGRLTYTGATTYDFLIICSLSYTTAQQNAIGSFYIAKNGTILTETRVQRKSPRNDVGAILISSTVSLAQNDYIEIFGTMSSKSLTLETFNLLVTQ